MARRNPSGKFVGTTEECFAHLFAERSRHERYALHKLLSDFCQVNTEAVSRWERGRQSIRGVSLIRLRCFLHLGGYEVAEVDGYKEPVRSLLLIVGLGLIDPYEAERRMGYEESNELKGLYRIILRNEGYLPETAQGIRKICEELKDTLEETLREKRAEITEALKDLTVEPKRVVPHTPPSQSEPVDPRIVSSFARSVSLTLSLGTLLTGNPVAAKAIRDATRGGMDVHELQALLTELLK